MNQAQQALLETDLREIMGIDAMSPDQQSAMAEEVGTMILDRAFSKLTYQMTRSQLEAFNALKDQYQKGEEYLAEVSERYPQFNTYVQEEILAFKKEMIDILGTPEQKKMVSEAGAQ